MQISFALSRDLSAALGALSRRTGTTLYMTLLAAFATLMSRYSNQTDVVLGSDTANRTRIETEALIGFFVNMLVLRLDLDGNPRFTYLLKRVRETTLAAYAHQESDVTRYATVVDEAFSVISDAREKDDVEKLLKGPIAHSGFYRLS